MNKNALYALVSLTLILLSACGGSSNSPGDIAPVVTIDPLNTTDTTPELTGTVDDPTATIAVTVAGNVYAATNNGDGTWTLADDAITPALLDGTYDIAVTATDTFSNAGSDATSDELEIDAPAAIFGNACEADAPVLAATAVPPGGAAITTTPVFTDITLDRALILLQEPTDDQCWYAAEQPGRVISFENDPLADEQVVFIDITARVDNGPNEAGLLGMAFHPNYASNGQIFLSYTGNDGELTSYISRFTSLDGGLTLAPDSEEILLSMVQPFGNHNGGNIAFGPDGYLYIGFGDGGSANDPGARAQNTLNFYGSMLRIDVDGAAPYAIPDSNPFAGNALCSQGFGAADCPEIYAWGLRNPWRWSFDTETGDLWLGDVGQSALEEIDIIDLGGNYGWSFFEGTRCNTQAPVVDCSFVSIPPVTEYTRSTGRSVTGGYVYRGTAIPDLVGVYVYADFASGKLLQYFDPGTGDVIEAQTDTGLGIASFAQANNGELYLLDLFDGGIHQIIAAQ